MRLWRRWKKVVNLCLLLNSTSSASATTAKKNKGIDEKLLYHKSPTIHPHTIQHPHSTTSPNSRIFFCVYTTKSFSSMLRLVSNMADLMTQLCSPFISYISLYVLTIPLQFKYIVLQSELNHNCSESTTVQFCNLRPRKRFKKLKVYFCEINTGQLKVEFSDIYLLNLKCSHNYTWLWYFRNK